MTDMRTLSGPNAGDDTGEHLPVRPPISGADLERVIHRAAELQFSRDEVPDVIDELEVVRIAEEVGLEGRYVRQALAELRADTLLPARPRETGVAAKLWGQASVQASRVVPGEPHEILAGMATYLREKECLRLVRDQASRQVWQPASDLMSTLQRGLDFSGRGYELAKARSIEVRAEALEPGRSLVTVTANLANQRAGHAAGWLIPTLAVGLGAALGLHFGEGVPILLSMPAGLGPTAMFGSLAAHRTYRRRRERVEITIHGILDRLEQGLSPGDESTTLRERIAHWWENVTD